MLRFRHKPAQEPHARELDREPEPVVGPALGLHRLPVRVVQEEVPPQLRPREQHRSDMAGELPAIIISDLFGVRRNTATQWAAMARDSWAGYLAALAVTR